MLTVRRRAWVFKNFQSFYTLIGPGPDVVTLVEFESAEQITRALGNPEAMTLPAVGGFPLPLVPTALVSAVALGIGAYVRRR